MEGASVPRVAIVIPALGDVSLLENTLLSVLENRPHAAEVIVVLNQPYGDPYDLKNEIRFFIAPRNAPATVCINLATQATSAAVVHLLSCGYRAKEGWVDAALGHFADSRVAAVSPLILQSDEGIIDESITNATGMSAACPKNRAPDGRPRLIRRIGVNKIVASGVGYRAGGERYLVETLGENASAGTIFGPTLAAAFYRRDYLLALGGFSPLLGDSLADVDLALAMREARFRVVFEPRCQVLRESEPAAVAEGAFLRGLREERLFLRNAGIVGWKQSLARHAWNVVCRLAADFPHPRAIAQFTGRLWAYFGMSVYRRRQLLVELALMNLAEAETTTVAGAIEPPSSSTGNEPGKQDPGEVRLRIDGAHDEPRDPRDSRVVTPTARSA